MKCLVGYLKHGFGVLGFEAAEKKKIDGLILKDVMVCNTNNEN